jgi:predicted DNA-binding transcriptional regulator AlpA
MEKIAFSSHYENLRNERAEFVKKIMELTGKSERTVYYWISGKVVPTPEDKIKISNFLNSDISDLFPNINNV